MERGPNEKGIRCCQAPKSANCNSSKIHRVPRMTLASRVSGKVALGTKMGRPVVLGEQNEKALLRYIKYTADHRYPVTRSQVLGLAWAISIEKQMECFQRGPSLKWWRGFKRRHPQLTLRKAESVDRGRVANATSEIINDYFDSLEAILEEKSLRDKPQQIYNSDEAAIFLNRSSEKVVVPVKTKHSHVMAQGTNTHITVLCCVSADGQYIHPYRYSAKVFQQGDHTRKRSLSMEATAPLRPGLLTGIYTLSGLRRTFLSMPARRDHSCSFKMEQLPTLVPG